MRNYTPGIGQAGTCIYTCLEKSRILTDDFIEYVFDNGAGKNLLLVGDSYANPFEPIIASHYHHTYSLDPRRWRGIDLSLSEFRKDHQVDDVIIVGGPGITVYRAGLTVKP